MVRGGYSYLGRSSTAILIISLDRIDGGFLSEVVFVLFPYCGLAGLGLIMITGLATFWVIKGVPGSI